MPHSAPADTLAARLHTELAALEQTGNTRTLRTVRPDGLHLWHQGKRYLNLSTNDYLGLTATPYAQLPLTDYWQQTFGTEATTPYPHGNPASRLMTGNSPEYTILEDELASLFPGKEALVLSCGYMVNSGLMPALTTPDDLILADKLVHASIIEGLHHSPAPFRRFRHNDLNHLETLLKSAKPGQTVWVIVESIYSMDGDLAPLHDILTLRERYPFRLYIDEAHSFGVRGPHGAGHCAELGIADQVDLIVCTFGKALAGAGACVLCSPLMRRYLINRMRPLIFSTALPPCTLQWDSIVVHEMRTATLASRGYPSLATLRQQLADHITRLSGLTSLSPTSQIIPLPAGSNERALAIARHGLEQGLWLTAIRHPTVPQGSARIRLSLNAGLTTEHISTIAAICNNPG